MNLSKLIEGYRYDKGPTYSAKTLESYDAVFKHVLDYFGDVDARQVTADGLRQFMTWLQKEYIPHRFSGDTSPLSAAGVDLHWKGIRSLFRWAHDSLDLPRPDLSMPRPKFQRPRVTAFSEEEVRKMVKAVDSMTVVRDGRAHKQRLPEGARDKAFILMLLDTGLRLGEALRLQVRDVNFETGEIVVAPFGTGKKTKPRMVVLGNTARRALWLYVAKQEDMRPMDRLFPMTPTGTRTMLRRLGKRAGVQDVHPHRFRHSFAIWFLRGGGDVFTLQRMLGHSDLSMVNYYLDIAQSDIAMAHKRASALDRWNANGSL